MVIRGKRIAIRPLEEKDVFYMRNWGYHDNPLLGDYNFPILTDEEIERWYKLKTKSIFNKYYGIDNEDHILIGYLGIKNIRRILRDSVLGIVLDPDYMNRGYGTEILIRFLKYYFNEMKMRAMYLEVAEFNPRAYRVYEKIGFKSLGYYLDEFFDPKLDLNNKYYLESKSSFVISNTKVYNYVYKMKIDKKTFLANLDKV